jgi:hypothetical protein
MGVIVISLGTPRSTRETFLVHLGAPLCASNNLGSANSNPERGNEMSGSAGDNSGSTFTHISPVWENQHLVGGYC